MHRSDITHSFSLFAANNDCCSHSAGFCLILALHALKFAEYFIAKVIPRQRRKVTRKRAKSKLVLGFAASASNLLNGTVEKSNGGPLVFRPLCEARPNVVRQLYFSKIAVRSAIRNTLLTAGRLAATRLGQASKNQACLGFATSAAKARQRQCEGRTSYIACKVIHEQEE